MLDSFFGLGTGHLCLIVSVVDLRDMARSAGCGPVRCNVLNSHGKFWGVTLTSDDRVISPYQVQL
jgi:hypothetical protein